MDAREILKASGLSNTRNRVNIINTLENSNSPLSGKEISFRLAEKCDKSTVHRTLNSLFEKRIVQRIIIDHEVKYALKLNEEGGKGHNKDHIHFKCSQCDKLFCLTDIPIHDYELPEGFTRDENQFLVIGKCKSCQ